ncbi:DUF4293 domain-containing protein [Ornithobacterium rhinotracheale]|uniref:DUF4293 family protein n=2 Tax=Ornithobacterium rhinotracheale TaxID=28251 RepID=I4A3G1_ORNRL|nr:DUF4293 domain-containing protein [Ornithobacterium rhinotracheale]AFL98495.1 hypothetical protein Ornrh_2367 [Ornithobacterium rhinotracheale DSM 15997]AIQ00216.1 transcription termination factor Rho [Ornithobacterium rhinotracheale ORT-UMN 88]KGB65891.1 hypothetical protein Q787_11505 [Ornithobacterium rhinotracheale H06-030791]MCK0200920.1 DUF4293 domain-containing protein [Ornithobacterium rhinotracheale]MCK0203190.1 DUF4293 domain-containing protein [Ornithobacterium rhinotracheale]
MIQRIQSVFLFLAAIVSLVISNVVDLWKQGSEWMQSNDYTLIFAMFLSSGILSFAVIFLYRNRKRQLIYNYINIFLNVVLVGLLAYDLYNLPGEGINSQKGIGLILPLISIILLFMANSGIKKDEKLVKSIDRIR